MPPGVEAKDLLEAAEGLGEAAGLFEAPAELEEKVHVPRLAAQSLLQHFLRRLEVVLVDE